MTWKTTCSRGHASGQNFLHYKCMMYGVVLTNHNILNMISNVHLIIIVLEKLNTKGNVVTRKASIFCVWQVWIDAAWSHSTIAIDTAYWTIFIISIVKDYSNSVNIIQTFTGVLELGILRIRQNESLHHSVHNIILTLAPRLKICKVVAVRSLLWCFHLKKTAVISINGFWKLMWAIGRNFVWVTAALAPWLPRPWQSHQSYWLTTLQQWERGMFWFGDQIQLLYMQTHCYFSLQNLKIFFLLQAIRLAMSCR